MATKVPQQKRVAGIAAAFAGASLVSAVPVHAQTNPPSPGGSAVSQYVELVPAAVGSKAPGAEAKTEKRQDSLPPAGENALKQAPPAIAKPLEKIATSSTYGAPELRAEQNATQPETQAPARDPDAVPPGATVEEVTLGTTVSAIASATDERLLGLLLTMLVTTLGAIGLALRRTRVV
jgi:hypothetical protein